MLHLPLIALAGGVEGRWHVGQMPAAFGVHAEDVSKWADAGDNGLGYTYPEMKAARGTQDRDHGIPEGLFDGPPRCSHALRFVDVEHGILLGVCCEPGASRNVCTTAASQSLLPGETN